MSVRAGLALSLALSILPLRPAATTTNTARIRVNGIANGLSRRIRNFNANQSGRTGARHQRVSPVILLIRILFIAPEHFKLRAVRLFPDKSLINVPLPFRRVAGHEISFEKVGPADRAVLTNDGRNV